MPDPARWLDRPALAGQLPYSTTVNEAVRLSGIGRTELYRLMREGKVQAKKHGRHTLVLMASVQAYISELPDASLGRG